MQTGHGWGKKLWAWEYLNRNLQNRKAKRIKAEKKKKKKEQNIRGMQDNYKGEAHA